MRHGRRGFFASAVFVEPAFEQCDHCVHRRSPVFAVGAHGHGGALTGGQQHHAHDALGVHLAPFGGDGDAATEAGDGLDQFGGGARVQAETVVDDQFAFDHGVNLPNDFDRSGFSRETRTVIPGSRR